MASDQTPEWETSKENIQPRKGGRSVGKLALGIAARTEVDAATKLKHEKE